MFAWPPVPLMLPPDISGPIGGHGPFPHQEGIAERKNEFGNTVLLGTAFGYFAAPVGTSEVLAQAVDHAGSDEFPHQRVAFVTASQFPQRIMVEATSESLATLQQLLPVLDHPNTYTDVSGLAPDGARS